MPCPYIAIAVSILRSKVIRHYALALAGTFLGAWLTDVTGSMLPLALASAALIMATLPLVRAIRARNTPGPGAR